MVERSRSKRSIEYTEEAAVLNYSEDLVHFNQQISEYFEEKKYKFLTVSIGLLGFGATFASIFRDQPLLVVASILLVVPSVMSVVSYSLTWSPTLKIKEKVRPSLRFAVYNIDPKKTYEENFDVYKKKFKNLNKKRILEDNMSQVMTLFYVYTAKWETVRKMRTAILWGIIGFFVFVILDLLYLWYLTFA